MDEALARLAAVEAAALVGTACFKFSVAFAVEGGFARVVDLSLVFIAFSLLFTTLVVVRVVRRTCVCVSELAGDCRGDTDRDLGRHSRLFLHVW